MTSVNIFICVSPEVIFGPFIPLTPVIKRSMVLLASESVVYNKSIIKLTVVATIQTIGIGSSSSFLSGPSLILDEKDASYF
jgi:hypothetical protein